jgi:pimeloyl-ACP methyl ester carboxylesterase
LSPLTLMVTVGGPTTRVVVVDGRGENREYLPLTLSFDHSVIDGAPAARFASRFRNLLETAARKDRRMTYATEMSRARARVAAMPSNTLTTRWGPVEFVDEGSGVPVFVSHGVLGGHDNIRDLTDLWIGCDYRAIGPSRFWYLGSAMPDNANPADQADCYAALLDHLGLKRVVALGLSAGGPAAIQLALRHPPRLHGLIRAGNGQAAASVSAAGDARRRRLGTRLVAAQAMAACAARPPMGVPKRWDTNHDADFLAIREALFPI